MKLSATVLWKFAAATELCSAFCLCENPKRRRFDVKGVKLGVSAADLVAMVREGRQRG
jgi:hypothetical protein